MKKAILIIFTMTLISQIISAQNIGIGTTTPNVSAKLDVSSSDKGMLTPRMTTNQREAIPNPADGLIVYDTNRSNFWFYQDTTWVEIQTSVRSELDPTIISNIGTNGEYARALDVQGNFVYTIGLNRFRIVDISDPASPTVTGIIDHTIFPFPGSDIVVQNNHAYVINSGNDEIVIVDISNPTTPTIDTIFSTGIFGLTTIDIQGNFLYVTAGTFIKVIDISNPSNPQLISESHIEISAKGMAIQGNYAYINQSNQMKIVDITDVNAPTTVDSIFIGTFPTKIVVHENHAYITEILNRDLKVVNISDPSNPTLVATMPTTSRLNKMVIQGNHLYSSAQFPSSFKVVNISDPNNPFIESDFSIGFSPISVGVQNNFAYFGGGPEYLNVFQLSPFQINSTDLNGDPVSIDVNLSNILSQGNDAENKTIINLTDPTNPQDAATKNYVDTNDDVDDADNDITNEIQNLNSVLSQSNDANNLSITNLADPINAQDAATKNFVENLSTPEAEIQLPFSPNWSNYSSSFKGAKYYKHQNRVYIEGLVRKTIGVISIGDNIATLPVGYRPTERILTMAMHGGELIRIDIFPTGEMEITTIGPPSSDWVNLTGIHFRIN